MKYASVFFKNQRTGEILEKMLFSYKELKHHGKRHKSCIPTFSDTYHTCMFKKVKIIDLSSEKIKKAFWRNNVFVFEGFMRDISINKDRIELADQSMNTNDYVFDDWVNISIKLFDDEKYGIERLNTFKLMYELGLEVEEKK